MNLQQQLAECACRKHISNIHKQIYIDFVSENISKFDNEIWGTFLDFLEIDIEEMKKEIEFWALVRTNIENVNIFGIFHVNKIAALKHALDNEVLIPSKISNY